MYIYVRYCLLFFMDCFPLCAMLVCPFHILGFFMYMVYVVRSYSFSIGTQQHHHYFNAFDKYRFDISQLFPLICITNVGLGEFRTRLITRHAV